MKRSSLVIAALMFAAAPAAQAADMALKAPPPPPAPVATWNGCYIGVNGGYGWKSQNPTLRPSSDPTSQGFWNPAFTAGAAPSAFNYTSSGGLAGAQIGCDHQFGTFVAGIETDLDWAHISGSQNINTAGVPGFVPGFFSSGQTLDWLGTVRGRLGVTPTAPWLLYVTGGLAYGEVKNNLSFAFPATTDFHSISTSNTNAGWTVGLGAEWMFTTNWSFKVEYLYVDLGNHSFVSTPSGRAANLATTLTESFQDRYNIVRGGLNFKFN
jgi:outer membrane immunogenic protein